MKKKIRVESVKPRNSSQKKYLDIISKHDISFGLGPAGTGKTFLAVCHAVQQLVDKKVRTIVLSRPIVEAGERLGFLPGDLGAKINPYLRPLYDSLYDILDKEIVDKMLHEGIIELAPLAYMRGRTFNNSFLILDEGQNTTTEQMKMFLTRIGESSKAIITGDMSQVDLPGSCKSGLVDASKKLDGIREIGFHYFESKDIVRHPLVQKIVDAYEGK